MTESIEEVYYFSKKEFLLLLGIGGIDEIYSFKLPSREELGSDDLALALHRLVRRGCVEVREKPVLTGNVSTLLLHISQAGRGMSVIPGRDGTQKICYLSPSGAVVTELADENGNIRISQITCEELWRRLTDGEALSLTPLATEKEGEGLKRHSELVKEEYESLVSQKRCPFCLPLLQWTEEEGFLCAWDFMNLERREIVQRVVFIEGRLNSWALVQTEDETQVLFDSEEFRENLRRQMFEGLEERKEVL